jgi:hypothetical protein
MEGTPPVSRSWLARLVRNPIAIIGAVGSVFVVLANAEGALNGVNALWRRWATPTAGFDTTWQGDWKSRNGFHFGFAMQLNVDPDGAAGGEISWQLLKTPDGNPLAKRTGATGVEYVSGRFDAASGIATLDGYRVSDPTLLGIDSYKFQIKPDRHTFIGMSKHYGEWEAQATGTVIVTERR